MRITAPRIQDERLVPLLDTPPKWLPGIDVGIQINFHLNFFFLFNWNILLLLLSFFVFKFPFEGVGFSCLEIPGWISSSFFFFFFVGNGVVRMLGWSGSFLMPLTPTTGCCDKIGSLRFVPFKPSVPHYQGQNRAIPAPHYLWNDMSCHHHLCTWLKRM